MGRFATVLVHLHADLERRVCQGKEDEEGGEVMNIEDMVTFNVNGGVRGVSTVRPVRDFGPDRSPRRDTKSTVKKIKIFPFTPFTPNRK